MSVESLMVHEVTLMGFIGDEVNAIGEPIGDRDAELTTQMLLQPTDGEEDQTGRESPIGNWRGFGKTTVDFNSWKQIVWEGRTFEIIAPARPHTNARLGVVSHQELDLQEVT